MRKRLKIVSISFMLLVAGMVIFSVALPEKAASHQGQGSLVREDVMRKTLSLTAARAHTLQFLPPALPGHPWRVTRIRRINMAAVIKATGAPFVPQGQETTQVFWVEAVGTLGNWTVASLYRRTHPQASLARGGPYKGGIALDTTTGAVLFMYYAPIGTSTTLGQSGHGDHRSSAASPDPRSIGLPRP